MSEENNINITINDQPVSVPKGTLVVEAAKQGGGGGDWDRDSGILLSRKAGSIWLLSDVSCRSRENA